MTERLVVSGLHVVVGAEIHGAIRVILDVWWHR